MSPASGDLPGYIPCQNKHPHIVSIQLMSPASGDASGGDNKTSTAGCFHSINVPSEWGQPKHVTTLPKKASFHSINVPSEWGHLAGNIWLDVDRVSIQLMSPASGDKYLKKAQKRI